MMTSPDPRLSLSWRQRMFFALMLIHTTTTAFAFSTKVSFHAFGAVDKRKHTKAGPLHGESNGGGAAPLDKRAYNDDALYNFHMLTQAWKIGHYSALDSYVNTDSLWNSAWHDSFVRNGLSDFVPPLTDALNVLVVGNRYRGPTTTGEEGAVVALGVEDDGLTTGITGGDVSASSDGGTAAAPLSVVSTKDAEEAGSATDEVTPLQQPSQDSSCSFLSAVFDDTTGDNSSGDDDGSGGDSGSSALDFASYDCIMDQGLIADLCANHNDGKENREDMARLLYQATRRISDGGIYVANTPPLSTRTQEYLKELGLMFGLQWVFHLDGISDEDSCVSVARKYFKDELPPGWQSFWERGLDDK